MMDGSDEGGELAASSIFISHTHSDRALAEAWRQLVQDLFADAYAFRSSSSWHLDSRPGAGQAWARWIEDSIRRANVALVLLTPSSVRKPWVLWEAGAVWGISLAAGRQESSALRPLVYALPEKQIPEPFRLLQWLRGDQEADVKMLCQGLMNHPSLSERSKERVRENLDRRVSEHMESVRQVMLEPPICDTEDAVREWQSRLDRLASERRASEVRHRHHWMDIAFGQSVDDPRPLDLGLHRRLGEIYMASKDYAEAADQLELARQLAPRDIYILRELGKAYLKQPGSIGRTKAGEVIAAIDQLDPQAAVTNVECAALKGKWLIENLNFEQAAIVYSACLDQNPDSYYLADLLAQVRLDQRSVDQAREIYQRALEIVDRVDDDSLWSHATGATAAIVTGNEKAARHHLRGIHRRTPNADEHDSITKTLERVRAAWGFDWKKYGEWIAVIEGEEPADAVPGT
jgi:tetratricopeptide (TPR) repeat protein